MKSKKLGILLLLLLAFTVTTGTFAYWAAGISTSSATTDRNITIGSGDTIATSVVITTNSDGTGSLIPSNITPDTGEVTSLSFTFNVTVTGATDDADGLETSVSAALTGAVNSGSTDVSSLFSITGGPVTATVGTGTTITVTVTMSEPADQATYNLVAGETVTLTFELTAAAATS